MLDLGLRIQPTIGGRAFEHRVFGDNLMAFTVNVMSTEAGLWLSLFAPSHASRTGESFTEGPSPGDRPSSIGHALYPYQLNWKDSGAFLIGCCT